MLALQSIISGAIIIIILILIMIIMMTGVRRMRGAINVNRAEFPGE